MSSRQTSERGASAVEYGLLVAAIGALIVAVIFAFSPMINDVFGDDNSKKTPGSARVSTPSSSPSSTPSADPQAGWVLVFKSEATDEMPAITVMMRCKGDRAFYVSLANGSVSHSTEPIADECT